MKGKKIACALLLLVFTLSAARADVAGFGPPPRNMQSEVFVELYKNELTQWNEVKDGTFKMGDQTVLWTYPNSGKMKGVITHGGAQKTTVDASEEYVPYDPCYVDSAGRVWGYTGYIMGHRQVWICVSDAANENLPADPEVVAAVDRGVAAMLWEEWAPVVYLVAGVAGITGVLLYVFWYRGKKAK